MAGGYFNLLTAAELSTLRQNYLDCLNAIATTGQSYNIGGRSFTRADLEEVKKTLQDITIAQQVVAGTRVRRTHGDFRR